MTYRVEISDCLIQFDCAHAALIESLGGAGHLVKTSISGQNHWQAMEHNWQKLYGAKPVRENGRWKYLDFDSEKQYTLFILRWS